MSIIFSVTANYIWIFYVFVVVISACSLSCNRFSSIRRLHSLWSREKEVAISFLASKSLRVSCLGDDRIKRCGSSSAGNGGKDKNGKGTPGNQWSCPKCGNPCTSVKRKWDELTFYSAVDIPLLNRTPKFFYSFLFCLTHYFVLHYFHFSTVLFCSNNTFCSVWQVWSLFLNLIGSRFS